MSKLHQFSTIGRAALGLTALLWLAVSGANGQTSAPQEPPAPQTSTSSQASGAQAKPEGKTAAQVPDESKAGSEDGDTHITPEQAKQLFSLVDELLKFSSQES